MAKYLDAILEPGEYNKVQEYTDANAIILAIRNLILSAPGNYPFNPSMGLDIRKYQFDLLDDQTVSDIQTELNRQIAKYIPELMNVDAEVRKVKDENGKDYLGISVQSDLNGDEITANFIFSQRYDGTIDVLNETY